MHGPRWPVLGVVFGWWLLDSAVARAGPGQHGIVGGEPTTTDPAVVAVATHDACTDSSEIYCTGTLIAPRLVLTAAHCVDRPVELVEVFFGDDVDSDGRWLRAAALRSHPQFDRVSLEHDVGAIILGQDAPVAPAGLTEVALSEQTIGEDARIIGFGVPEPGGGATGLKRSGTVEVTAVGAQTFEIGPNPAMSCQVDSGGPVLLADAQGIEVVAGITSHGDAFCEEWGINTRVDAYRAGVIEQWLGEAAGGGLDVPAALDPATCPGCGVLGCGAGQVCDLQSDMCVPESSEADGADGGCSVGGAPKTGGSAWLLLPLAFCRRGSSATSG